MAAADKKPAPAPDSFPLTLEEFCAQRSQADRRVELLGAFYAAELRAGHLKDTATAYANRLVSFASSTGCATAISGTPATRLDATPKIGSPNELATACAISCRNDPCGNDR